MTGPKYFVCGAFLFYIICQGGDLKLANTIYFWPTLSISQEQQKGFDMWDGKKYHWILSSSFLFWAVGVAV